MFNRQARGHSFQKRPGLVDGYYPQKKDTPKSFVQKLWSTFSLSRLNLASPEKKYQHFIASIHSLCAKLEGLGETTFQEKALEIRRLLHSKGITDELCLQAFALVREAAWRTLGMRHFDCQLIGGWIMVHGRLAEMETGEGKTFTATLAAATASLAGIPVHVITVNDYLVRRDADLMGPLYRALGLEVAGVTSDMTAAERRKAYRSDIVYCTNKQLVFDYLRDRILMGNDHERLHLDFQDNQDSTCRPSGLFLPGLCFAIIDEADSVLIDEARTPLIISKQVQSPDEEELYVTALAVSKKMKRKQDFNLNQSERKVSLTEQGRSRIAELTRELSGIWKGKQRREEFVTQALEANWLYTKDRHYLVDKGKIVIVDENSGRVMADRSWERGLHQLIEVKEGCALSGRQEHIARLTYQRFFRRYICLGGMSGTLSEVRQELWTVYGLPVEKVATNKRCKRFCLGNTILSDRIETRATVVNKVLCYVKQGRPVLIGTRTVADSESLSVILNSKSVIHQVLNARQDAKEADIVTQAGRRGAVTVATNMAGRGTDIPLEKGVAEPGGLHVIATDINEAKRIDRQLYGRAGRQGDPGSYETVYSLDDELLYNSLSPMKRRLLNLLFIKGHSISQRIIARFVRNVQRKQEKKHRAIRKDLLQVEEQIGKVLAFSGRLE